MPAILTLIVILVQKKSFVLISYSFYSFYDNWKQNNYNKQCTHMSINNPHKYENI